MAGLVVLTAGTTVGVALEALELLIIASDQSDWDGKVVHLPFK